MNWLLTAALAISASHVSAYSWSTSEEECVLPKLDESSCPSKGYICNAAYNNQFQVYGHRRVLRLRCKEKGAVIFIRGRQVGKLRCIRGRWRYGWQYCRKARHAVCAKPIEPATKHPILLNSTIKPSVANSTASSPKPLIPEDISVSPVPENSSEPQIEEAPGSPVPKTVPEQVIPKEIPVSPTSEKIRDRPTSKENQVSPTSKDVPKPLLSKEPAASQVLTEITESPLSEINRDLPSASRSSSEAPQESEDTSSSTAADLNED